MLSASSFKACYDEYDICVDKDKLMFGNIETNSKSLMKNLCGCKKAIVFVGTIGIKTDMIIGKYSLTSPASAVVAQAIGTVMIERWCDVLWKRLAESKKSLNLFLRPRFSPGYGDLPLEFQKNIFEILDCPRKIGVSLNDSLLMTPSKSVSAIVGVSEINSKCNISGCEVCNKVDCSFRRG